MFNRRRFLGAFLGAVAGVSFLRADSLKVVTEALPLESEIAKVISSRVMADHFFKSSPFLERLRAKDDTYEDILNP